MSNGLLLTLAALALIGWFLLRRRRRSRAGGGGARRLRCSDCRHLVRVFDDGVSCGVRDTPVFKNPVHIANCMDHERR
jgi:hypothetical protein